MKDVAVMKTMAARPAVVATEVGGKPEVVVYGVTGLLVPPREPVALSDAVTCLLPDRDSRWQIDPSGHERVAAQFDDATGVRRTEELVQQLLQKKLGVQPAARNG